MIRIYIAIIAAAASLLACSKRAAPTPAVATPVAIAESAPPSRSPQPPPSFLAQVYFAFDSAVLTGHSVEVAGMAADFFTAHPGYSIRVDGYADTVGSEAYNKILSHRRAQQTLKTITSGTGAAIGRGEIPGPPASARRAIIRITP